MSFSERLKQLRKQRGESLQKLADTLGVSKPYLWELESGNSKNPSADFLIRLSDHFGCTVDYLLGRNNDEKPSDDDILLDRAYRNLASDDREIIKGTMNELITRLRHRHATQR